MRFENVPKELVPKFSIILRGLRDDIEGYTLRTWSYLYSEDDGVLRKSSLGIRVEGTLRNITLDNFGVSKDVGDSYVFWCSDLDWNVRLSDNEIAYIIRDGSIPKGAVISPIAGVHCVYNKIYLIKVDIKKNVLYKLDGTTTKSKLTTTKDDFFNLDMKRVRRLAFISIMDFLRIDVKLGG